MKIEIIRFSPGWWLWLPGLSKQLDLRATDERASKEEFKAQVQLRGRARLNVARLAAASIHHFAPEWVSQVRRPCQRGHHCVMTASALGRHGDAKPQNSNKSAKKNGSWVGLCDRKATSVTELLMKLLNIWCWWKMFLLLFNVFNQSRIIHVTTWFTSPAFHF